MNATTVGRITSIAAAEVEAMVDLIVTHPVAIVVNASDDDPIYRCPGCGKESDCDGCDVIGADPGCLFCTDCHCEFQQ